MVTTIQRTSFQLLTKRTFFHSNALRSGAYDGDGKTTVTILNKQSDSGLMVDTYGQRGFRLNNGIFVYGPVALFPKTALSWNVEGDHDIHEKSLRLFTLIEPKLDLLVIGYGKTLKPLDTKAIHMFRIKSKINIEILPIEKAAPTFNYLCSEGRWVAGAFIPPMKVHLREGEMEDNISQRKDTYDMSV